jgi:beta-lactamase class A
MKTDGGFEMWCTGEFKTRFHMLREAFSGNTGLTFMDIDGVNSFCYNESRVFSTASVIKIYVLARCWNSARTKQSRCLI